MITIMFSVYEVTEIYRVADDLCKEFASGQEKYVLENKEVKHRDKPNRMSDAEIKLFSSCSIRAVSDVSSIIKISLHTLDASVFHACFLELGDEW